MPATSSHEIRLIQESDGWTVEQDRRTLIDQLDEDEAIAYAERRRKPDEAVVLVREDGREHDITRDLRRQVRR